MPIYEYQCADCGVRKEHLQKVSEEPISACPVCGSANYKKLLSAAGFQLKGSGWYATDFKNSGGKSTSKTETKTESAASSDATSSSSSDDKGGGGSCGGGCACH